VAAVALHASLAGSTARRSGDGVTRTAGHPQAVAQPRPKPFAWLERPYPTTTSTAAGAPTTATPATAPTATPTPAPPTPPLASTGTIISGGGRLLLDGRPYRFVGVNAYELATEWGVNAGCGAMLSDDQLNAFFAALRPNSLVRIWVLQGSMATNFNSHQLDWGPLDRVFNAAANHGQRLIASLAGIGGVCDNMHWQDPSWFNGGYMSVFND
jgi:hypothetical protein